jgi:hypothetical protein
VGATRKLQAFQDATQKLRFDKDEVRADVSAPRGAIEGA